MTRRQCEKCPWKVSTDPHTIPNGYSVKDHCALERTIARSGEINLGSVRMMACHESPPDAEEPCVGWLMHQLGPGNNIGLRILALTKRVDTDVELIGEQHERFEDTLPQKRRKKKKP